MTERPFPADVAHFVATSPYQRLMKPVSAIAYLKRQLEAGEECADALRAYPALQIEPLEFFYTCLRNLSVLDDGMFESLLGEMSWRGVVWGAWLAMLEPRQEFRGPLLAVHARRLEHNHWIVALDRGQRRLRRRTAVAWARPGDLHHAGGTGPATPGADSSPRRTHPAYADCPGARHHGTRAQEHPALLCGRGNRGGTGHDPWDPGRLLRARLPPMAAIRRGRSDTSMTQPQRRKRSTLAAEDGDPWGR